MNDDAEKKPGFIKFVLATIFQGFLLGIGVCIVFAAYQRLEREATIDHYYGDITASGDLFIFPGRDYRLQDLREIRENGSVWIVGRVDNLRKDRPLRGFELQANLFKGKTFIDQYSERISGGLPPGGSRLFKINCGCKGDPPAAHDRFEVAVVRTY